MPHTKEDRLVGWESPRAIHPGEFLVDVLEEFSMSQDDLAKRIGLTNKAVNEIIKGKSSITERTARGLYKVFPISKEYWINLQTRYESDKARLEERCFLQEEADRYLRVFIETYQELAKIGFVKKLRNVASNTTSIVLELQKFFGVNSLKYVKEQGTFIQHTSIAFRKYSRENCNPYTIEALLRLGRLKVQQCVDIPPFDKSKLRSRLEEMAQLSCGDPEVYVQKLEDMLYDCGVVFACLPYLKNTHIQGAAMWVGNTPLVMVTANKKSEDRFWFDVFHEICHILRHGKKGRFVDFQGVDADDEKEQEANLFAEKYLIANFKDIERMLSLYEDYEKGIVAIARKIKRSPAILAGRIAHEEQKNNRNMYGRLGGFFKNKIEYRNVFSAVGVRGVGG